MQISPCKHSCNVCRDLWEGVVEQVHTPRPIYGPSDNAVRSAEGITQNVPNPAHIRNSAGVLCGLKEQPTIRWQMPTRLLQGAPPMLRHLCATAACPVLRTRVCPAEILG